MELHVKVVLALDTVEDEEPLFSENDAINLLSDILHYDLRERGIRLVELTLDALDDF